MKTIIHRFFRFSIHSIFNLFFFNPVDDKFHFSHPFGSDESPANIIEKVAIGVYLGSSFLHMIFCILLLVAVKQRNPKLVIPWLVEMPFGFVAGFAVLIIMGAKSGQPTVDQIILLAIFNLFVWGNLFFFFCIVFFLNIVRLKFFIILKMVNRLECISNVDRLQLLQSI